MATPFQIQQLRNRTDIQSAEAPYTDEYMSLLIDARGEFIAAAEIWEERAAKTSKLINMSEGGSSRNLSDIHKNALAMASKYRKDAADALAPIAQDGRARMGRMVRG